MRQALLVLLLATTAAAAAESKRVLLISFDGFRHDLVNETFTPFINEWANSGVWFTNGLQSQYVSYTIPNHLSIITGLREDGHGIYSNYFYDPDTKQHFDLFNTSKLEGAVDESLNEHWYNGEPIWVTNQKAGGQSVVMYWPAVAAKWKAGNASWSKVWKTCGDLTSWMADVDEVVEKLASDPKNTFAALYVTEPDKTLHLFGFYFDGLLRKKVAELDKLFGYIVKRLKDRGLLDTTDIILTADHGHSEIQSPDNVICIADYVIGEVGKDFEFGDHMLYPLTEEFEAEAYANLTRAVMEKNLGMNVYLRKDIPTRFHYSNSSRVGQIVIETKVGWAIALDWKNRDRHCAGWRTNFHYAAHGMDPTESEMRALLVMNGPSFPKGKKYPDIPENIDLYGLMAKLLKATPAPNHGSMEIIGKALHRDDPYRMTTMINPGTGGIYQAPASLDSLDLLFIVLPSLLVVGLFFLYTASRKVSNEDSTWTMDTDIRYKPLQAADFEFEISTPEWRRARIA